MFKLVRSTILVVFAASMVSLAQPSKAWAVDEIPGTPTTVVKKAPAPSDGAATPSSGDSGKAQDSEGNSSGDGPSAADEQAAAQAMEEAKEAEKVAMEGAESSSARAEIEEAQEEKIAEAGRELAALDHVELLARAEEVDVELEELREGLKIPSRLGKLRKRLAREESELNRAAATAKEDIAGASRWFYLNDIQFDFTERLSKLEADRAPMEDFAAQVQAAPERLDDIVKEWTRAETILAAVKAPATVVERVGKLIHKAHLIRLSLSRAQAAVAQTGAYFERMGRTVLSVLEVLEVLDVGAPSLLSDFDHQSEPASNADPLSFSAVLESAKTSIARNQKSWAIFVKTSKGRLLFHFILLLSFIYALRKARQYYSHGDREEMRSRYLILRRPWAGAFIITALATIFVYPVIPAIAGWSALLVALGASAFLLSDGTGGQNRVFIGGSFVMVGFLAFHMMFAELASMERWVMVIEGIFVLFICVQLVHRHPMEWSGHWRTFARIVVRVWGAAVVLGLVAGFMDYDRSSATLIDGTARIMLLTVAYRVFYDVASSIILLASESPWVQSLNAFRSHGQLIAQRVTTILRWFLLTLWVRAFLTSYTLIAFARERWEGILDISVEAGSLSVKLESLIVLVIGIFLAISASRLTRFSLEQDVMPRTSLRSGTSAAVVSGVYYIILGFGIFTTLVAVGFELDKITILVSALGVGIGFGLQNIVQNFVAGIILIFGRPINVGDRVQLDDLIGTVQKVGFRASTVKTIQGAEVIVPNSQFVSEQVINWSLSDDRRRVDLDVGVKYGSNLKQVLEILLTVAKAHDEVLNYPAPEAIVVAFGDNSINFQLRAWTEHGGRWMNIRSDMSVEVDLALKEADIEIPFPQRDLHLRTIDGSVLAQLNQEINS